MVSYLNKLFIERLQSRRKSIEISQPTLAPGQHNAGQDDRQDEQLAINEQTSINQDRNGSTTSLDKENLKPDSVQDRQASPMTASITLIREDHLKAQSAANAKTAYELIEQASKRARNDNKLAAKSAHQQPTGLGHRLDISCPGILYALVIIVAIICSSCTRPAVCNDHLPLMRTPINDRNSIMQPTADWQRFGSRLVRQLAAFNDRWVNVPNDYNTRDQYRYPRQGYLVRAFNGIRNRIGTRNTIRVHNAFRDLAWRLLSRLSMPTPVIYELRRQHFYSPSEDMMNDSLYNKNTTQTIRSKRLWQPNLGARKQLRRAGDDDDDDEPENFRERLRMRLDNLIRLSRRSLFGRVVRLPAIFPFKRQEDDDDEPTKSKSPARRQRQSNRHKKKKETDRQIITINGKQYYVDDDEELKELNKETS